MANPPIYNGLGYIGLAKQGSGYGTQGSPTAPSTFFQYTAESIKPSLNPAYYRSGASQQLQFSVVNSFQHSGTWKFPLTSNAGSQVLWGATGGTDSVSGSGDPYTHSWGLRNDLAWFTVERAFADQHYIERIQDCKFNGIKLEGKQSDIVWCTPDIMGSYSPEQGSPATVVYDADPPFMMRDGQFAINGVAANSVFTVVGFSIDIKRNVKPSYTTHPYPDFMLPTAREIDVTIDLLFDTTNAQTWYRNIMKAGGTTTPSKNTYIGNLTVTIDPAATPDHQIQIVIPALTQITADTPLNINAEVQMLNITGKAQRPSGGGDEITFSSKNLTASSYSS